VTWAFDLAQGSGWSRAHPLEPVPSPADRSSHALVWDLTRERLLLLGGVERGYDQFGWAYRASGAPGWEPIGITGASPPFALGRGAVYDALRDRVIAFGGGPNEVWALPLGGSPAWTPLATFGAGPALRRHHAAVLDPAGDRLIVYGGESVASSGCLSTYDEVWALSLAEPMTWTLLASGTGPPSGRAAHSLMYDAAENRVIVVGGYFRGCPLAKWRGGETWSFDLSSNAWSQLFPMEAPFENASAGPAVLDTRSDRIVLFIGSQVYARAPEPGGSWTALGTSGVTPPCPAALYDHERNRILVAQTAGSSSPASDQLWALQFEDGTTSVTPPGTPAFGLERVASGARRSIEITMSLADGRAARLGVYDLAGRCLAARDVGTLGAGRHTVALSLGGDLHSGVVFVQLRGEAGLSSAKFAIFR
jgi:hypothetical protein